jgi:hypothetical protein
VESAVPNALGMGAGEVVGSPVYHSSELGNRDMDIRLNRALEYAALVALWLAFVAVGASWFARRPELFTALTGSFV